MYTAREWECMYACWERETWGGGEAPLAPNSTPGRQAALWKPRRKPHPRYPWRDVKLLQSESFMMTKKLRSGSVSGRSLLQGKLVHSFPRKTGPWWLQVQCTQLFCLSELLQVEIWSKPLTDVLAWHKKKGQNCQFSTVKIFPKELHVPLMVPLPRKQLIQQPSLKVH